MIDKIKETYEYLRTKGFDKAEVGIILGTGLGKMVDEVEILASVEYSHIPHFPTATVEYHGGTLVYGKLEGKKVILLHGRFHLYEGYNLQEITFPVRVLNEFGIKHLIVSNAAGAVNLEWKKGDLMLIEDHINMQGGSPLAYKGTGALAPIFVDMREPYLDAHRNTLKDIASSQGILLREGVYASVVGPQLETRAEYRMLKMIGADAVGMSTVPEVIVANHVGIKVAAISILTDECDPNDLKPINIPEILEVVAIAEPKLVALVKDFVKSI